MNNYEKYGAFAESAIAYESIRDRINNAESYEEEHEARKDLWRWTINRPFQENKPGASLAHAVSQSVDWGRQEITFANLVWLDDTKAISGFLVDGGVETFVIEQKAQLAIIALLDRLGWKVDGVTTNFDRDDKPLRGEPKPIYGLRFKRVTE